MRSCRWRRPGWRSRRGLTSKARATRRRRARIATRWWVATDLGGMAKNYIGEQDPKHPLASPIHADYRGLPPLLIQVGDAETLLDDSTRVAKRAKEHGVSVDLEVWDDMIHVWHAFAKILPGGAASHRQDREICAREHSLRRDIYSPIASAASAKSRAICLQTAESPSGLPGQSSRIAGGLSLPRRSNSAEGSRHRLNSFLRAVGCRGRGSVHEVVSCSGANRSSRTL